MLFELCTISAQQNPVAKTTMVSFFGQRTKSTAVVLTVLSSHYDLPQKTSMFVYVPLLGAKNCTIHYVCGLSALE
jgi:hypothetical protein